MRGVTTLFIITALLLGCGSFNNLSDEEHITKAKDHLDKGQNTHASIQLKNALSKNPNNAEARWLLGKVYFEMDDPAAAEKELTRARELGVSDDSVVPLLAKVLVTQQKYEEVFTLGIGRSLSNEAAAEINAARGLAYLGQGNVEKAAQELDAALQKNSKSLYGWVAKARQSSVALEFEAAQMYLKRALEVDSDYVPAWSFLGDLNRLQGRPEAAVEAYTGAIDKSADSNLQKVVVLQKRALLLLELKRYEEAQQDIDEMVKRNSGHPGVLFAQGMMHFHQQHWLEAEESFAQTLTLTSTDSVEALYYLGTAQLRQGKTEQAIHNLSRYVTVNPLRIQGRLALALLKTETRDYGDVVDLVRPVVATESDNVLALKLLSIALMNIGQGEDAIEMLERLVVLRPDSAAARTELAIAQMRIGEELSGLENLEAAIALDPQYQQADVILVLNYLKEKSFHKALQAAQGFAVRKPESALAFNLVGSSYLGLEKTAAAEDAFNTAIGLELGNPFANYALASLALQEGDTDKARGYYQAVLMVHENDLKALLGLVELASQQQDTAKMQTLLEQAITAHPEAIKPRHLLAKLFLLERKPEQTITVLEGLPPDQVDDVLTLGLQAEAQLAIKDYKSAKSTLQKLISLKSDMAQAHFLLAQAYAGLSDKASMEQQLSRTLLLSPEHFYARVGMTRLQVLKGEIAQARENLKRLQMVARDNPDVLALEASIAMHSGEKEHALVAARARYEASPDSESLLDLVRIFWVADKQKEAIHELKIWLRSHSDDVKVRLALAEAYIADGRKSEVIAQYEEILRLSPDNQKAMNNLAYYLLDSEPDRAIQLAEKAYSSPTKSAAVMDTLAAIWLRKGDVTRARRFNERALERRPESPSFLYRRVQILKAEGKPAEAVTELRTLLGTHKAFLERQSAIEMLERLETL